MASSDTLYTQDPQTRDYVYPDTLSFNKEPFATVIPYRSPSFKVHRTEGLANSALSHHREGAKYELKAGVWTKIWEFKVPDDCESCGSPLDKERDTHRNYYGQPSNKWFRSPLWTGSVILTPYLCAPCYERENREYEDKQKARQWAQEQKRRKAFDAQNKI